MIRKATSITHSHIRQNVVRGRHPNWEQPKQHSFSFEAIPYTEKKGKVRVVDCYGRDGTFATVKRMCETLEYDGYKDEILVLGYNMAPDFGVFKEKYPDDKIIVYQLEQISDKGNRWFNEHGKKWLAGCDEIWDYDLDNIMFLQSLGYNNAKFRPMQWFEGIQTTPNLAKDIDVLFYGSVNAKRKSYLNKLNGYNIKILTQASAVWGDELNMLIGRSKVVLNLHYYDSHLQEQVRLFPLVANNICVLSEKSVYNYFGDMIMEFDGDELIPKLNSLLKNHNVSTGDKFKNRKYKVGVCYNTFYGLEQIQSSINSISPIVDYVVIVHQRRGFSGEPEGEKAKQIIAELQQKYDVVFYQGGNDPHQGVIDKRNIGLEHCRNAGCDFIIPLDTDEEYNCAQLRRNIDTMFDNNIDTLYSPIETYYYDRNHCFDDNYFVPTVYRINDRKFGTYQSLTLSDPARRMEDRTHLMSKFPMRHYSYMKETYIEKISSHVMTSTFKERFKKVYDYMMGWKDGMPAMAFTNTSTGVQLTEIPLKRVNS